MTKAGDVIENPVTGERVVFLYPTSPPRALQKILFAVLDPIGRALGYVADVPYEKRR